MYPNLILYPCILTKIIIIKVFIIYILEERIYILHKIFHKCNLTKHFTSFNFISKSSNFSCLNFSMYCVNCNLKKNIILHKNVLSSQCSQVNNHNVCITSKVILKKYKSEALKSQRNNIKSKNITSIILQFLTFSAI